MKLIDSEKLKEAIKNYYPFDDCLMKGDVKSAIDVIFRFIEYLESESEQMRCEYCRCFLGIDIKSVKSIWCYLLHKWVEKDFFCSDFKRKEK